MSTFFEKDDFTLANKIRIVTATSLFDGHDAAIHIMRRILQSEGAEVIHLGHNRSAQDIVRAAIQEDVQGIAISSYQGGHLEYFTYILDLLKSSGAAHIKVFGGGGGVISAEEIKLLHQRGVTRIFSPKDGLELGLVGMIRMILKACDFPNGARTTSAKKNELFMGQTISLIEQKKITIKAETSKTLVLGITGPGGAGKSSLTDELLLRFLANFPKKRFAVLSVDPSRRRSGGALLGDRIRMNSTSDERVFMRSMATRQANSSTAAAVASTLTFLKNQNFDLIFFETAGIGQSSTEVCELSDLSVYVMTPEFGAPSQLEKIDMLDFADFVVLNKFDRQGALDALRDVQKTYQRNRQRFDEAPEDMPVFGTCAHVFNDSGIHELFQSLLDSFGGKTWVTKKLRIDSTQKSLIPQERGHYLSEIVSSLRSYKKEASALKETMDTMQSLHESLCLLSAKDYPKFEPLQYHGKDESNVQCLLSSYNGLLDKVPKEFLEKVKSFQAKKALYEQDLSTYEVRGKNHDVDNFRESLSQLAIPKVRVPELTHWGEILEYEYLENKPGSFPFTNGVFPFKRTAEDPTRMFAGEGDAEQTNSRFHFVSKGQNTARLSTAFDSVTLYGEDPHTRPDIYGKIGNAGVSICSLDDAKRLYSGFDLKAATTSVSMTINGPAPIVLAFFLNAAIDAECERFLKSAGKWAGVEKKIKAYFRQRKETQPCYRGQLPEGHDGSGLGFLGVSADKIIDPEDYERIKVEVLKTIRGTVQADILKEDQAQNTCIFSTQFAMRLMGDVQEYFTEHDIRNFYSVSISGYHIAEAGATPVTQLAFTLANGFTILEYYLGRGMKIDDFARNLSFFFSNGMDPEYAVIGRVARRIWAIVLKKVYGADERSQKLKYHIQTSGRSLHAQEMEFNDIRTTLQALYALADNCSSLHTNAFDEALTTPTEKSVRRAIAIQMIINNECGLLFNENPLQGSYFIEKMTDLVEEAVLDEFKALDTRGGVLGAMETMYQRSKIQEESMTYEHLKHSGELKIVGVNFWKFTEEENKAPQKVELRRSSDKCKDGQVEQVEWIHRFYRQDAKADLGDLKTAAIKGDNIFAHLMEASKVCTLGQVTHALFEAGGEYRRNM